MGPGGVAAGGDRQTWRRSRAPRGSGPLLGRDAELARLLELLGRDDVRLITITGRSGAGKTRLAAEAAARAAALHPGGSVTVELAGLESAAQVEAAVAAALDLRAVTGAEPRQALVNRLCAIPSLLVLDDADLVADGIASVVELLAACPGTHLLGTAGTPLRVDGERVVRLGSLALPDPEDRRPDRRREAPAVALFCERAEAVDGGFRCTPRTLDDVVELVGRLDGLPLAIELAAARVATLPPAAQLRMLGEGSGSPLDLRRAGGAQGDPRRVDLRASIAWSHGFLTERERIVLRRMSVFAGAPTLGSIRAVCEDRDWDASAVLDAITGLVDVHLVDPDPSGTPAEPRFRIPPIVAAFGREQLELGGETDAIRERHAQAGAALARRISRGSGTDQVADLRADREDLHAALGFLVDRGDVAAGLSLAIDMALLWQRGGFYDFQRQWLDRLLAAAADRSDVAPDQLGSAYLWRALLAVETATEHGRPEVATWLREGFRLALASDDPETRLFAHSCQVQTVFLTRDLAAAGAGARAGLALATERGDSAWMTRFLAWAGMMAHQGGDPVTSAGLLAQALHLATQRRDRHWIVVVSLALLALPEGTPGRPAIVPPLPVLLDVCREAREPVLESWVLARLAWSEILAGRIPGGVRWSVEGLGVARRTGALSSAGFPMLALAMVAFGRGEDLEVARLYGAVSPALAGLTLALGVGPLAELQAAIGVALTRGDADAFDAVASASAMASLPEAIGAAVRYAEAVLAGDAAGGGGTAGGAGGAGAAGGAPADVARVATSAEGAALVSAGIVAAAGTIGAAAGPRRRRRPSELNADGTEPLTGRELDVLRLLARGDTNKEIGDALGLRPKTVMHHSMSIYQKLGVRGRAEATAWAYRSGLLAA